MGRAAWTQVWGPLLRGKFGDRGEDISMAWLWAKFMLRRQVKDFELLLLESSDWQFLITTVSAADYSEMRFARHFEDLERLHAICSRMVEGKSPDAAEQEWFREVSRRDSLFEEIDLGWWRATGAKP